MFRANRMISTSDIRKVLQEGEIIEEYPEDVRGHGCLMLALGADDRPIHIVCTPKDDYLVVISAYIPDENQWSDDYRMRIGS